MFHISLLFSSVFKQLFQHVKKNPYLWNELREEMANYDRDTSFVANLERMYV
jgi:GH18 family chitinase